MWGVSGPAEAQMLEKLEGVDVSLAPCLWGGGHSSGTATVELGLQCYHR